MSTLVITRGIPASGKTSYAKAWVAEHPGDRFRLSRDDLRKQLFNREGVLPYEQEEIITKMQQNWAAFLLGQGKDVILDDMNLALKYARQWANFARDHEAEFAYVDFTTNVEECIRRDNLRLQRGERAVGEHVIRTLAERFASTLKDRPTIYADEPKKATVEPYFPDTSLPQAWIFDIDGTLAKMSDRGPFDWSRVGEDALHAHVRDVAESLRFNGYRIVIMSGRKEVCRPETEGWLVRHGIDYDLLLMRSDDNNEKDSIMKAQLFDEHVRNSYSVRGVFDDRDQCVKLWRSMNIPCFQVAEGDF